MRPGEDRGLVRRGDDAIGIVDEDMGAIAESAARVGAVREATMVKGMIAMARSFPRNRERVVKNLLDMCKDPDFAAGAMYSKPIGGKKLEGLSIRFAEAALNELGNVWVDKHVIDEDERRHVRAEAIDLEKNNHTSEAVIIRKVVERRGKDRPEGREVLGQRLNSEGEVVWLVRATEDEMLNREGAAFSKAKRNLIVQMFTFDEQERFKKTIRETRQKAAKPNEWRNLVRQRFAKYRVSEAHLGDYLGKPLASATVEELYELDLVANAMEEGMPWSEIMEQSEANRAAEKEMQAERDARETARQGRKNAQSPQAGGGNAANQTQSNAPQSNAASGGAGAASTAGPPPDAAAPPRQGQAGEPEKKPLMATSWLETELANVGVVDGADPPQFLNIRGNTYAELLKLKDMIVAAPVDLQGKLWGFYALALLRLLRYGPVEDVEAVGAAIAKSGAWLSDAQRQEAVEIAAARRPAAKGETP